MPLAPPSQLAPVPMLADVAEMIRREVEAAEADLRSAVAHAIRAGEPLNEAKAQLPHGAWLKSLAANVALGRREAENYMRLARMRNVVANLNPPTIREAVALLATPRAEALYSSASGDWSTPDGLFCVPDKEFRFTLDVVRKLRVGEVHPLSHR